MNGLLLVFRLSLKLISSVYRCAKHIREQNQSVKFTAYFDPNGGVCYTLEGHPAQINPYLEQFRGIGYHWELKPRAADWNLNNILCTENRPIDFCLYKYKNTCMLLCITPSWCSMPWSKFTKQLFTYFLINKQTKVCTNFWWRLIDGKWCRLVSKFSRVTIQWLF